VVKCLPEQAEATVKCPTSFPGSSLFLRKDPGRGWSPVTQEIVIKGNVLNFIFIMTRLPAILNVINNMCYCTFQARSWIVFYFQGKDSTHAKLYMHRRRNIYVFYSDWSIKRYQINDMVIYGWSVSCPIFKTKDLFYNGILWLPKHRQLCVNNCAILILDWKHRIKTCYGL
jgi:hypothetical protein